MAKYKDMVLTEQGKMVLARIQMNEGDMILTRAVTGDGMHDEEELSQKVSLNSERQSFPISRYQREGAQILIRFTASNLESVSTKLSEDYYIQEIGIYAKEKESQDEFLYAIGTAVVPVYMPAYDDVSPTTATFNIYVQFGNGGNVTIQGDSTAFVSVQEMNELRKSISNGFTFVIDSEEKVLEWLHRKEGNDYSRILVRKKEDEADYDVKVGRKNSEYTYFPLTADYVEFEEGVKVHFSHPIEDGVNSQNKAVAILRCKSSRNVAIGSYVPAEYVFSGGSHINAVVLGTYCGGFNGCDGLYGCVVDGCDMSWTNTYPFYNCQKLYHCEADGILLNGNAFYKCMDLVGCHVGDNYTNSSFYKPYCECSRLYGCTAEAVSARGPGAGNGKSYSQLFSRCRKLYDCRPVFTTATEEGNTFDGMVRSECTEDHDLWDETQECFWQIRVNNGQLFVEKVYEDE